MHTMSLRPLKSFQVPPPLRHTSCGADCTPHSRETQSGLLAFLRFSHHVRQQQLHLPPQGLLEAWMAPR